MVHFLGSIIDLLEVDAAKVHIVTSELSFRSLLTMLSSLVIDKVGKESAEYEEFRTIKTKLSAFEEYRNTVAHSVWAHGSSSETSLRMKITSKDKKGLNYQNEEVKVETLINALEKAGDANVELAYFIAKICGKPIQRIEIELDA